MKKQRKGYRTNRAEIEVEEIQAPVIPEQIMSSSDIVDDSVELEKEFAGKTMITPQELLKQKAYEGNIKVAILSEDGFEEEELTSPKQALEDAGALVDVISPHNGTIKAWDKDHWGKNVNVDLKLRDANERDYDAIILPGGVMNPDKLRQNTDAILFLRQFIRAGKPVAAICHGAQTLIETGMIDGKTMTSYPSLRTDLRNAGVNWIDQDVVHYGQFITSRQASDLGAFNRELIYTLSLNDR